MAYELAFALGGGGVRGMAHVGVLIELERAGIIPDLIVGSSMGAVMGGVYAYQQDADYLWGFALRFADNPVLKVIEHALSHKPGFCARIGAGLGLSLGWAYVYWQGGFLTSARLKRAYRDIIRNRMLSTRRFLLEDCRVAFAPLAVDLGTARAVIMTTGDIPDAMFASSALPGVCKPHRRDGMALLDGGLVSVVPVMAAHLLGAKRIIAVDTDAKVRGTYANGFELIEQASAVRGYRWNMLETDLADCVIAPQIAPYAWSQFSRTEACIQEGRRAARTKIGEIKTLLGRTPDKAKAGAREALRKYYPHVIV